MALADEVTARFENQLLIELTNKDSRTATTVNTTLLALAVTDAESAFKVYSETTYDGDEGTHVLLGIQGVIAALEAYTRIGHLGGESWEAFKTELAKLRTLSTRSRLTPQTDSPVTRTSRSRNGNTVRPWADWPKFREIAPRNRNTDLCDNDDDDVS